MFVWDWFTGVLGMLGMIYTLNKFIILKANHYFSLCSRSVEKIGKVAILRSRQCWKNNTSTHAER